MVRSTAFWASVGFGFGLFVVMAAAAEPDRRVHGRAEGRRDGGRRRAHIRDLLRRLGESGRVHARDEIPQHRAAQLDRASRRGVVAVIAAAAGAGPWALALQQIVFMATLVAALWCRAGMAADAGLLAPGVP